MPQTPIRPPSPMPDDELSAMLRGMPKAELHIHIEGALEPEDAFAMALRNGAELPYASASAMRSAFEFKNLQGFLDAYHASCMAIRTRADFRFMAERYLDRAAADHVAHSEIFFDTQSYAARGIGPEEVILGLHDACSASPSVRGTSAGLILCFLRHLSEDEAFASLEQAGGHLDKIVGVGLASSELGNPPAKFSRVFAKARRLGLRLVAHAGEEGPPSYVRSALEDLKVDRLDHGARAMEDRSLVELMAKSRIPLTVCPLSNVKLRVFPDMASHCLGRMLSAGLAATVNSDDPAYFGGHVNENYLQAFGALGLGPAHAKELAINSFRASFIPDAAKELHIDRVEEYFAAFPQACSPSSKTIFLGKP